MGFIRMSVSQHGAAALAPLQDFGREFAAVMRALHGLTKPTISLLVVVTAVPALFLAAPGFPDFGVAAMALIGTYLASAGAAVFNHLIEADRDADMVRTQRRPLPSGQVPVPIAIAFGIVLTLLACIVLFVFTTPLACALSISASAFYVLFYTYYLKPRTVQNIVIGGAAGAIGPLIGWAAVAGELSVAAWLMFLVIFLWTPPHFWALALKYKDDYARVGLPMYPVVFGERRTHRAILAYSLSLVPVTCGLFLVDAAGWLYLWAALVLSGYFVWLAVRLLAEGTTQRAMTLFHYSCLYLFGIFGALTFDALLTM